MRPPILFGGFFIFLLRGRGAHICRLGARCLLKCKKGLKFRDNGAAVFKRYTGYIFSNK